MNMTTDKTPTMQAEPYRAPALAVATLTLAAVIFGAVMLGADLGQIAAAAAGALAVAGAIVAKAESVRQFTDSPATMAKQRQEAEAIFAARFPDDVVTGMFTDDA